MTLDHYDSVKDKKEAVPAPKKVETKKTEAPKKGGVPAELKATAAAKAPTGGVPPELMSIVQKDNKWPNDHYDGKKSDGLDNGVKTNVTNNNDHYDDKKLSAAIKTAALVANTSNNTNSTAISTAQVE